MLLFVAHASVLHQEVKCRFYGPCAVKAAYLNGIQQLSLTEVIELFTSCCVLKEGTQFLSTLLL